MRKLKRCSGPNAEMTSSRTCSISTEPLPSGLSSYVTSLKKLNDFPSVPAAKRFASCGNWKSLWMIVFPVRRGSRRRGPPSSRSGRRERCRAACSDRPSPATSARRRPRRARRAFCFTCSSVSPGRWYPFRRKAVPNGLSFGKIEWQVWQEVWYLREKAGTAFTRVETRHESAIPPARNSNPRGPRVDRLMAFSLLPITVRPGRPHHHPASSPIRLVCGHPAGTARRHGSRGSAVRPASAASGKRRRRLRSWSGLRACTGCSGCGSGP